MKSDRPTIRAVIDGTEVDRPTVEAWERRRLPKAAARIGLPRPDGDLATARLAFADAKIDLGHDEVRRRLRRVLPAADVVGRATASAARGGRRTSVCDLYVAGGDAASFVEWFGDDDRPDYERSMLAGHPDHFLIATAPDGRQEVIETTGGSPLPTRFFVDYEDHSSRTPHDPEFPFRRPRASPEPLGAHRSAGSATSSATPTTGSTPT